MINIKNTSLQLTERDVQILFFINEFGFCTLHHLERRFEFKKPRSSQIVRRLEKEGLIQNERIFHQRPSVYRLTSQGARYTDLPPLKRIPLGTYLHELTLVDVYLKLREEYPNALWVGERRLKHDKFLGSLRERDHMPDGLLVLQDDRRIAIEVELTLKSLRRLEEIFKNYGTQFEINEVWYYCSPSLIATLQKCAYQMPWIRIFSLKEFIETEGLQ